MSLIAEFYLSASRLPLMAATAAVSNTKLELDRLLTTNPEQPVLVCWAETDSFEAFDGALDNDDSVTAQSVLEITSDERLYHLRLAKTSLFPLKAALVELGASPDETTITKDGWDVRVRIPNREALAHFRTACGEYDLAFRLDALYEATANQSDLSGLTHKQHEALLLAHENGYFEIPRKTSLGELSQQLDISKPSLSARLRRAEQRLIKKAISTTEESLKGLTS